MNRLLDSSAQHVMLDLETLSTKPNAVITEIGAVVFNSEEISAKFYCNINIQSCLDLGLQVDGNTIAWRMKNAQVQEETVGLHIETALIRFNSFIAQYTNREKVKVYGNSSAFDNVILRNAFEASHFTPPWNWNNDRCYRTLKNLYPHIELERIGTHHNALNDAESQAEHMIDIARFHNGLLDRHVDSIRLPSAFEDEHRPA